jgi:hypothetical protein
MDIELCSNDELVDELVRRTSFAGIIIRSVKEGKGEQITIHQNWDITYSNGFENQEVANLLEDAVAHFRQLAENE